MKNSKFPVMEADLPRRTVSIAPKVQKIKLNESGKRIIENWCQYAKHLARREREKRKKPLTISKPTLQDAEIFGEALDRLREIRAEHCRQRATFTCCAKRPGTERRPPKPARALTLRRVKSLSERTLSQNQPQQSRLPTVKSSRAQQQQPKSSDPARKSIESRSRSKSRITRQRPATRSRSKSKTRSKSAGELKTGRDDKSKSTAKDTQQAEGVVVKFGKGEVHYPVIKRRKFVPAYLLPKKTIKEKPVINYPPIKRRPWNPCDMHATEKPKVKKEMPKINYPELKMRKPEA